MERWCHNWSRNKAFWKNGVNLTTEAIYGTVKSLNLHVFGLEVFLIILKIEMGIIKVWQSTKIITTTTRIKKFGNKYHWLFVYKIEMVGAQSRYHGHYLIYFLRE